MDTHDVALAAAGVIGAGVAVFHGFLTQRLMVKPLTAPGAIQIAPPVRRIMAGLLQFSTFNWFVGGLALLVSVFVFQREARLATSLLVGSSYLFGALGNLWASRGRHPGWVLYGTALLLIVYGLGKPGG